ncbi:hypothetical protein ABI125_12385 [Tamlana crocina]
MKTKSLIAFLSLLLASTVTMQAQSLSNKIKKSVVEIGETFTEIPKEELLILDQIAYKLHKEKKGNNTAHAIFIDKENDKTSQLAMIWLKTGLHYYGLENLFNIESAGIENNSKHVNLNSLNQFGFKVKNDKNNKIKLKFGSGSWDIHPKNIESLTETPRTIKIATEEGILKNHITLHLNDTHSIPKEMLYIATRINNLEQIIK